MKAISRGYLCFVLALLYGGAVIGKANAQAVEQREISALTVEDRSLSERQRRLVAGLFRDNFGVLRVKSDKSELRYLQKILDKKIIDKNEQFDLQALGVVLGDIMVKNLPTLKWVIVEDRYGRSRGLRYGDSEQLFFPVTMISRRYSHDMEVNVEQLYKSVETEVKAML